MSGDALVAIVGVLAALFLAWRGLRAQRIGAGATAWMAAAWLAIIVIVAFLMSRYAP